jgi:ABC-type nitrate/sulfonate/bicarbonate transport system permease component
MSLVATLTHAGKPTSERLLVTAIQLALVVSLLAVWQIAPDFLFDEMLVSRPSLIAARLVTWLQNGVLFTQAGFTLQVVLLGLLYGGGIGTILGLTAALVRPVERLIEPAINILFALPKSSFVPLFILWFGISTRQHTIFVSMVVFFFFFFATFNGVRSVPNHLRSMLAISGASPWQKIRFLYLPASFNWLLNGLRLGMPHAFLAAISAEIIASRNGLGHLVKANAAAGDAAGMFAALIFLVFISVTMSSTVLALGARSRWRI